MLQKELDIIMFNWFKSSNVNIINLLSLLGKMYTLILNDSFALCLIMKEKVDKKIMSKQ